MRTAPPPHDLPSLASHDHRCCRAGVRGAECAAGRGGQAPPRLRREERCPWSRSPPAQGLPEQVALAWAILAVLPLASRPPPALAKGQARKGFPATERAGGLSSHPSLCQLAGITFLLVASQTHRQPLHGWHLQRAIAPPLIPPPWGLLRIQGGEVLPAWALGWQEAHRPHRLQSIQVCSYGGRGPAHPCHHL